jgi:hypothetical protein
MAGAGHSTPQVGDTRVKVGAVLARSASRDQCVHRRKPNTSHTLTHLTWIRATTFNGSNRPRHVTSRLGTNNAMSAGPSLANKLHDTRITQESHNPIFVAEFKLVFRFESCS